MIFPSGCSLPSITLVLGGARSGKSVYAERLINASGEGLYIATAEIRDEEMARRVRIHRKRRSDIWTTVEAPLKLAQSLREGAKPLRPIMVDCLSIWLGNIMEAGLDAGEEMDCLIKSLNALDCPVVLVSGVVGMGIVPDNKLARDFVDATGWLNQAIAIAADRVVLVTAGLPMTLKDAGP